MTSGDGRTKTLALLVAFLAVGGVFMLSRRRDESVRVLRMVVQHGGREGYPGVTILLSVPNHMSADNVYDNFSFKVLSDGKPVPTDTFGGRQMVDPKAIERQAQIFVPAGYDGPLRNPKLEFYRNGKLQQTIELPPMPPPIEKPLPAKSGSMFRLTASPEIVSLGSSSGNAPNLKLRLLRTIPKNETWTPTITRTDRVDSLSIMPSPLPKDRGTGYSFSLPYATKARAAEIVVHRSRTESHWENFRIPDLRLVDAPDGQTFLVVPKAHTFVTAQGERIEIPVQRPNPHPLRKRADERRVYLTARIEGSSRNRPTPQVTVVSPTADSLGVKMLFAYLESNGRGGGGPLTAGNTSDAVGQPLRRKPFTAVIRVTTSTSITLPDIRACMPIERE